MKILMLLVVALIVVATVAANTGAGGWIFWLVERLPGKDLTGHFLLYGTLGFSVAGYLCKNESRSTLATLAWILVVGMLVAAEEFSQSFFPSRTFSWADLAASLSGLACGATLAVCVVTFCLRKFDDQNRPRG